MDLGIAGRKAIVCASSKGLGKACAVALAEAGCAIVVNGRDARLLEATAEEIRGKGATVTAIAGDIGDAAVQAALFAACPAPDILVNNNGGPPPQAFDSITREDLLRGLDANMLDAHRADQGGGRRHEGARLRPNHQHHLVLGARADRRPRRLVRRARRASRRFSRRRARASRAST